MKCPRCAKEIETDEARFCPRCGLNFAEHARHQSVVAEDEVSYCYRHPKETTGLKCGRCERPICTKCAILGPAGPRCPDCAKTNVAVRPAAIAHEAKRSVSRLFSGGIWSYLIAFFLISMLFRAFGGCRMLSGGPPPPPVDAPQDETGE
ncbi:zinc-ribbon domain-containing protein [Kamptonema cortianum]|nr:zinc-ribbon domain-containing protein [Geitlerinema splendidum]MDK3162440.1 zinc-ribbon domain-containing protein [Kamptonema cortianum]